QRGAAPGKLLRLRGGEIARVLPTQRLPGRGPVLIPATTRARVPAPTGNELGQGDPVVYRAVVGCQGPDAHGCIRATGDHGMTIGGERRRLDGSPVIQPGDQLPRRGVPDARGAVVAGGEQASAVRTEAHVRDEAAVPGQHWQGLAGGGVPDTGSAVAAAG